MNKKIEEAINKQINEELFSEYIYLSIAAYADYKNLKGFAQWFTVQAKEERDHAMGFYLHLLERGGQVKLEAIKKPPATFGKPVDMFTLALKHEKYITDKINKLYELARKEKDYAFESFVKWYIDEQVEEEATASEWLEKLKMAGDKPNIIMMIDKELEARQYTPGGPQATGATEE
ncbi:ferritin [Patescibacteria group bacterium]|nr:ferritin [Patescibacteria group bacterium]